MNAEDYGGLLLSLLTQDSGLRERYRHMVDPELFTEQEHIAYAEAISVSGTSTELIENSKSLGGRHYVELMTKRVEGKFYTEKDLKQWFDILVSDAKRREAKDAAKEFLSAESKLGVSEDVADITAKVVSRLTRTFVSSKDGDVGFRTFEAVLPEFMDVLSGYERNQPVDRVKTGLSNLDNFMKGGMPTGVITLGSLPGLGKTSLAMQIARNVALDIQGKIKNQEPDFVPGVVAIFSREMRMVDLLKRLVQAKVGVSLEIGISPKVREEAYVVGERVATLPIIIDDSSFGDMKSAYTKLEALRFKYKKVRLIVLDFAELFVSHGDGGNMEQQVGAVYISATQFVKRYNCPVIVISHLNRDVEYDVSKVPGMRHLRYSRLAEGMSHVVWLIYYPHYYVETGTTITPPMSMPSEKGVAYVIFAKGRSEGFGFVPLGWNGELTLWSGAPKSGMYATMKYEDYFGKKKGVF